MDIFDVCLLMEKILQNSLNLKFNFSVCQKEDIRNVHDSQISISKTHEDRKTPTEDCIAENIKRE